MPKAAPLPTLLDHLTPDDIYGLFGEEALSEGKDALEREALEPTWGVGSSRSRCHAGECPCLPSVGDLEGPQMREPVRMETEGGTP